MANEKKKWLGTWPAKCDLCKIPLETRKQFFDARTITGHWAMLCPECFVTNTRMRLGTGFGQMYDSKTLEKLEG